MLKVARFIPCILLFISPSIFSLEMEEKELKKPFIGADISMANTLGTGTFLKNSGSASSFSTGLTLYPYLNIGPIFGDKKLKLYSEFYTSIEWLESNPPTNRVGTLDFADLKFRAQIKNALSFNSIGISITPGLKVEVPTSSASAIANRLVGFGANLSIVWSKWGLFAAYKPVIVSYIHSVPYKSIICKGNESNEERLASGQCIESGRQTMALLKNGLFIGYTYTNHTLTLGMRTYHGFLRPVRELSSLSMKNQSSQSYSESTLGIVEYAYAVPTSFPLSFTIGITSFQPSYDPRGGFKIPFFDWHTPANNFSTVYVGMDLTV